MKPSLHLDLTRSLDPVEGDFRLGAHGDLPPPQAELDPARGLPFPLKSGGFVFAGEGIITDDAGDLEVVFSPRTSSPAGALVHAWGQYVPLIELHGSGVSLNVYGTRVPLRVRWAENAEYTLQLSWDHRAGVTLALTPPAGPTQRIRRRLRWKAFRQQYAPFTVGGAATEPRFRQWSGSFEGWVRSVKVFPLPLDAPGLAEVNERGEPIALRFPPAEGVRVLEIDDPPLLPDPLGLVQLPDRLGDLRRSRDAADLDRVVAGAATEIERFALLTHWVANLWPHCNYWPWPQDEQRWIFWKRGHEMIPDIRAGRMGGMCGGFAHVMEEIFWSLGFDARRIQVTGHSSFEAYSNEQDRWIVCDASANKDCYLLQDSAGCFLGCADLIRRHDALEYNPRALDDVRLMICERENLRDGGLRPLAYAYDHVGLAVNKSTEYGKSASTCRGRTTFAWYLREPDRPYFRPEAMGCGPKSVLVEDLDHLYPSRNRCRIAWSWAKPGEALRLAVKAAGVTFFDSFLVSTDGGPASDSNGRFTWRLHPGVNTLTVRTRNRLGALGYPFRIVLWKKPA